MNRPLLLGAGLALVLGCNTGTSACGSPSDIGGQWTYTGDQNTPSALLSGTLTLTRTGTCTVSGTLMLTINSGTPTTTGWPTTGDFLDDSIVELNADSAGGVERHHLGTVRGDTIAGPWSTTGGGASGTFKLVRSAP